MLAKMKNKSFCKKCGKKVKSSYDFCPKCGAKLRYHSQEEWGLLGRNDTLQPQEDFSSILSTLAPGNLGKMLNGAMKMLEKEINKAPNENFSKTRFKLMINGKEVDPEKLKRTSQKEKIPLQKLPGEFSKEKQEKFSKLKKEEPEIKLRRFGDKINYDLEVPGVKSLEDISIRRLENGLEIKALGKNKAYQKVVRINLPLSKYFIEKEILTLQLETIE